MAGPTDPRPTAVATGPAAGPGRLKVLTSLDELRSLRAPWVRLARRALEPNPFFGPDFFLPLLERRGPLPGLRTLVVRRPDGALEALLPLLPARIGPGRAVRTLRTAYSPAQPHGLLATPLIDAEAAEAALDGLLDGLDRTLRPEGLLELLGHAADGPFAHLLEQRLDARRQPRLRLAGWSRRLFRPRGTAEAYLAEALGARHRSELRRQRRQLERRGSLALRRLGRDEPVAPWAEAFLALEAAGWKGRNGTALALDPAERAFFVEMCERHHAAGLLAFDALELDLRPIAMACSLRASDAPDAAEFVFKIAYDEGLARQSPGMQLQLALLAERHTAAPRPVWVDSCAAPSDSFYEQLWLDRRHLGHVLIAARRGPWPAVLEAIRLARKVRDAWPRRAVPAEARGRARAPLPVATGRSITRSARS